MPKRFAAHPLRDAQSQQVAGTRAIDGATHKVDSHIWACDVTRGVTLGGKYALSVRHEGSRLSARHHLVSHVEAAATAATKLVWANTPSL